MSFLTPNSFFWGGMPYPGAGGNSAADPQIQFFENMLNGPRVYSVISVNTLSVHAVNIPVSISFNQVAVIHSFTNGAGPNTDRYSFGLYSLNGSTLSLANSASGEGTYGNAEGAKIRWISMQTSATQNISPGPWYFALVGLGSNGIATQTASLGFNSPVNFGNAAPGFVYGRMTASTNAMPASIATSTLDVTGVDASKQPYILITA